MRYNRECTLPTSLGSPTSSNDPIVFRKLRCHKVTSRLTEGTAGSLVGKGFIITFWHSTNNFAALEITSEDVVLKGLGEHHCLVPNRHPGAVLLEDEVRAAFGQT